METRPERNPRLLTFFARRVNKASSHVQPLCIIRYPFLFSMMRYSLYLLLLVGLTELLVLVPDSCGSVDIASEYSMVECLQIGLLLVTSILLFFTAHWFSDQAPQAHLLLFIMLLFTIRESDLFMDTLLFDGAWQLAVCSLFLGVIIYVIRHFQVIIRNARRFIQSPSCGILLSGLFILLVFSRLFGQRVLWHTIMGDQYMRLVKNAAEEGTELLGYYFIMVAIIEWMLLLYIQDLRVCEIDPGNHRDTSLNTRKRTILEDSEKHLLALGEKNEEMSIWQTGRKV